MAESMQAQTAQPGPSLYAGLAVPVHDPRASLPPAGWYVDPFDALQRRWWNGTEWTGHVRVVVSSPQPGYAMAPSVISFAPSDTRTSIRDLAAEIASTRGQRTAKVAEISVRPRRGWRPSTIVVAILALVVAALGAAIVWGLAHPEILMPLGIAQS